MVLNWKGSRTLLSLSFSMEQRHGLSPVNKRQDLTERTPECLGWPWASCGRTTWQTWAGAADCRRPREGSTEKDGIYGSHLAALRLSWLPRHLLETSLRNCRNRSDARVPTADDPKTCTLDRNDWRAGTHVNRAFGGPPSAKTWYTRIITRYKKYFSWMCHLPALLSVVCWPVAEALHCPVVLSQSWILTRFAPNDACCLITELRQYLVSVIKLIPAPTIPARTFPQRKYFV